MERDFIGFVVKQEGFEEPIDAVPLRSSRMQWQVANKTSSVPQLLSFEAAQPKTGFDSLKSTGLVSITTTETFDSGSMQESKFLENQGGVPYTVTSYPIDTHTIYHPIRTQTNLTASPAMGPAVHQSFIAPSGQNLISPLNPQPMSALTSSSPVVSTTDIRNTPKLCGAPAQLTIFYNGSVCVYDNVSSEKAHAIMLLAGNGPPSTSNATVPAALVQVSMPKPSILESFVVNQPYVSTPHMPTHTAKASHSTVPQSICWSGIKQEGILVTSNKVEPQKVVSSPLSVSATLLPSSTVPQFRRKSLARFLEKRKERVISSTPYANNGSPDYNSSVSCPLPTVKYNR